MWIKDLKICIKHKKLSFVLYLKKHRRVIDIMYKYCYHNINYMLDNYRNNLDILFIYLYIRNKSNVDKINYQIFIF